MITSVQNSKVKQWKKLHKRKERETTGTFLIEGSHLVEEAYKSDWEVVELIVQENVEIPVQCQDLPTVFVSDHVFKHITQTTTPQGIAALLRMKKPTQIIGEHVLLIDAIQDPGNLGTIIRTADAAGFDTVVLGDDTVDVYNGKVIRATQGSLFHIAIYHAELGEEIMQLKLEGYTVWATALTGAKDYNQVRVDSKTALIVGNEGAGIKENILQLADVIVKIPIHGKAESLNVSVAAGILMYYVKG